MSKSALYVGDSLEVLRTLPDESVHCVVTSPPYWGLRDYGVDGQIGLEETLDGFLDRLVSVFLELRRVLRKDGTCWVNMGDAYCTQPGASQGKNGWMYGRSVTGARIKIRKDVPGLKPKNLVGQPWRLAFALQDDGWILRSDIIWHKPNPMPESVTDRPTKSHEYVFLLTKSAKYFYDAEAVKDAVTGGAHSRRSDGGPTSKAKAAGNGHNESGKGMSGNAPQSHRNARTVWTINTQPYSDAHFATFPLELPARCIKAGSSEKGCCPECGTPWERVVERSPMEIKRSTRTHEKGRTRASGTMVKPAESVTTGWRPTCDHTADPIPCTILDLFSGAGTTGLAAMRLGRDYIGIELNPEYAEMSRKRLAGDQPMFNTVNVISGHPKANL